MTVPLVYLVVLLAVLLFLVLIRVRRKNRSHQRETDLRLTYKRYMELYPHSTISYPEYKKLQARKAYKKAVSSMKIKRLVR